MTAFASPSDVAKALRRDLSSAEEDAAPDVLAESQDLVLAYLNRGEEPYATKDDVPDAVRRVTARMAARVFQQEGQQVGVQQTTAGPFSQSYVQGAVTGSPWLAAADKTRLNPYRRGRGMTSVAFNSERGYDPLWPSVT